MSLGSCRNVDDFRKLAKKRLPSVVFDYLEGGTDDEWTLRNNTVAFDRYQLSPRYLVDVSKIDTSVKVLGCVLKMPIILSPVGGVRLFHQDKELGIARAAARWGVMFSLAALATTSIEEIGAANSSPKLYQIYLHEDRGLTVEQVERCRAAGFAALCLTIDTPVAGNRERIRFAQLPMPFRWGSLQMLVACVSRPAWGLQLLIHRDFRMANLGNALDTATRRTLGIPLNLHGLYDRRATWKDAEWLARLWNGPFVIKGILSPEDARHSVEIGATAIMISNHGGRQLDGVPAPVDCIRPIRDSVEEKLELIVDGGIRRGVHIAKALALGADACAFGRPQIYALAAAGQRGVELLLQTVSEELVRTLALLGCASVSELSDACLAPEPRK